MRYTQRRKGIFNVKWFKMFNHRIIRELRIASRVHPLLLQTNNSIYPLSMYTNVTRLAEIWMSVKRREGDVFNAKYTKQALRQFHFTS